MLIEPLEKRLLMSATTGLSPLSWATLTVTPAASAAVAQLMAGGPGTSSGALLLTAPGVCQIVASGLH